MIKEWLDKFDKELGSALFAVVYVYRGNGYGTEEEAEAKRKEDKDGLANKYIVKRMFKPFTELTGKGKDRVQTFLKEYTLALLDELEMKEWKLSGEKDLNIRFLRTGYNQAISELSTKADKLREELE